MTRHETPTLRTHLRRGRHALEGQTVAASVLAGGCLAVVALWKAAANGATTSATR